MAEIFARAINSLRHRAVWWMMLASAAASIFIILGLMWLVDYLVTVYKITNVNWIQNLVERFGFIAAAVLGWFLFPVMVPTVAGLFEDKTAEIIELSEYGLHESPHKYPLYKEVLFLLGGVFLNILFLPIYLVPVVNLLVYYLINSYVVGKGVFMMVASRYYGVTKAREMYERYNLKIKLYGLILAIMAGLPVVNLIAPLFAVIVMVHYSKQLAAEENMAGPLPLANT